MVNPHLDRVLKIVLAVDGSDHSWAAIDLLSNLPLCSLAPIAGQRAWQTRLTVATVILPRDAAYYSQRRSLLEKAAEHLNQKGLEVETEFITGYPAEALHNLASELEPDLFVLGAKGLRSAFGILLGGVAQQLVEYASWPVLIVRAPFRGLQTILFATDGSSYSQSALEYLGAFPLPTQVKIKVLHVMPPVYPPEMIAQRFPAMPEALIPYPMIEQLYDDQTAEEEQAGKALLDKAVEYLEKQGIEAEPILQRGDAAEEIIEFSKENRVDLLVSGCRGLNPVKRFLLGSVSRKLVHYANTSVLVVKR